MNINILKFIPGILLSTFVAFLGILFSDAIGVYLTGLTKSPISPIMLSIIIGLILGNFFTIKEVFQDGLSFSIKFILRLGIVCLGIRLGILEIVKIGVIGIPLIVAIIVTSILFVGYLSRLLSISEKMGSLIAVGTSICGASAIVATSPTIEANNEEVSYAVANITIFGLVAMLIYPYLAHYIFNGDEIAIGLFLGTAIHETAQVAGAGLIYAEQFNSPNTMDIATITKLVRNVSMILVIPAISYLYIIRQKQSENKVKPSIASMFPIFILGFILMGLIRTLGDYGIENFETAFGVLQMEQWEKFIHVIRTSAEYFLAIAMAALGINTNIKSIVGLGMRPFYVGFSAAVCVGLVSYLGILGIRYFV